MKFENTEVWGFKHALRGMRNPMNSWDKGDSYWENYESYITTIPDDNYSHHPRKFIIGDNDMKLAQTLIRAGSEHRKFMRQIFVSVDITAPMYWIHELDTYKVGVSRNSCSMQHKGVSKPFSIRDFSVEDERAYDVLDPIIVKPKHSLVYRDCSENDYKIYKIADRKFKVFRNGRIFACPFSYTDSYGTGRTRFFEEKEIQPYQNPAGYWCVRIGGRKNSEHWLLHRLVASLWLPTDDITLEINHINGNKGDNDVDNLEWVTHSENELHKHKNGLVDVNRISTLYKRYKTSLKCNQFTKFEIIREAQAGASQKDIAKKYNLSQGQVSAIILGKDKNENTDLFESCMVWEKIIAELNDLRDAYLETKDYKYFRMIRQLLPMGYNYKFTLTMNYENIYSMIHQRKHHKLNEWSGIDNPNLPNFISWARTLPYAKELIFLDELEENDINEQH